LSADSHKFVSFTAATVYARKIALSPKLVRLTGGHKGQVAKLTRVVLLALKEMELRLGRGERECIAIAKHRSPIGEQ